MKVLSIDGGGIRGIIPALILTELETRTGKPVCELFDMIAGTSTGGILATGLTAPDEHGKPRWTAKELVGLYRDEGPSIFHRSLWKIGMSAGGLLDEKLDVGGLEKALDRYLGETRLSQALTRVLITAYELETRNPWFFKSWRAGTDPGHTDYQMKVVARATSAAPTYFEPLRLEHGAGKPAFGLVDGGVFANNPGMCAFAEVRRISPRSQIQFVSLGTGQLTHPIHFKEAKDWGLVEWVRPVIDVVFDGVSDTVDYQLSQLLEEGAYHRFQAPLKHASDAMDDASPQNLKLLEEHARTLIKAHDTELATLADLLVTA